MMEPNSEKTELSIIDNNIILGWGSSNIYRENDEESKAEFKAAAPKGVEMPDGGFTMFVVPWNEWAPWRPGHRVRFAPGSFSNSIKAIENSEYPSYIYGDGMHIGYSFTALANSLNEWGAPGSVKWWEGKDGLWASFIPGTGQLTNESIIANLRDGIIRQVSIGSTAIDGDYEWNNATRTKDWTLVEARIREASPVTDPKYVQTTIYANNSKENTMSNAETKTNAIDTDAIIAALKGEDAAEANATFSAEDVGAAIGSALGAFQQAQSATAAEANTVPVAETPAEPAEASKDASEDANTINLTSLREALTKGDK